LSSDTEFDSWGFDRDNGGEGAAQHVIDHLRKTGEVTRGDGSSFAMEQMNDQDAMMFLVGMLDRMSRE
jgi:hypothetical protein